MHFWTPIQFHHFITIFAKTLFIFHQTYLDAFVDAAASPFGFLVVSGRVAVATTKWWEMAAIERVVLTLLLNSLPRCTSRDVPVFLPVSSPKVMWLSGRCATQQWPVFHGALVCYDFQ